MKHHGLWSREKERPCFLDDITALLGQLAPKFVLPLGFLLWQSDISTMFKAVGFSVAEIAVADTHGLQAGFDPGSGLWPPQ